MKRSDATQTLIRSLTLVGAGLLAYPGGAHAAADDGAQAQARALLSPAVRSVAANPGSDARAPQRVPAPDAVQLAQRFITGASDVRAEQRVSSAAEADASGRLGLTERRHDANPNELIRRTILGQRV